MPFNADQDKFLIEAYYRSGEKVAGLDWTYDIRACHAEFYARFPAEEPIAYDVFAQYVRRLVGRFERTGGVARATPRRAGPTKVTGEWLRGLEATLAAEPGKSIRQIAKSTGKPEKS